MSKNKQPKMLKVGGATGIRMMNFPAREFLECDCQGQHLIGFSLCDESVTAYGYFPSGLYDEQKLKTLCEALADVLGVPRYTVHFEESETDTKQPPVVMQ